MPLTTREGSAQELMALLSRWRHRNLVQFLGVAGPQHMPPFHPHTDAPETRGRSQCSAQARGLGWGRLQVLALALSCLHGQSPRMLHRNFKPGNLTEVGEPLGRGRLQTDHAQRWNEGRWTAARQHSGFIQNQRKNSNGSFVLGVTMSLRNSCRLNSRLKNP